jgi:voltage-gated potassium channel
MESKTNLIYDTVLTFLSIFAIILLGIGNLFTIPLEIQRLFDFYDLLLCGVFFIEFCVSLYKAQNKTKYFFTYGWIDLISSIPVVDALRVGRLAKVLKLFRFLRLAKSSHILLKTFTAHKAGSTFFLAFTLGAVILCINSILILLFEVDPHSNIKTAEEALWWSLTTVTTVGYGDFYPVTGLGRLTAGILMLTGIGVFGILTASLASMFNKSDIKSEQIELIKINEELEQIKLLLQQKK